MAHEDIIRISGLRFGVPLKPSPQANCTSPAGCAPGRAAKGANPSHRAKYN